MSVARECGILHPSETVIDIEVVKPVHKDEAYRFAFHVTSLVGEKASTKLAVDLEKGKKSHKFAMTGNTWGVIKEYYPELIPRVVSKGVVFARMSGEQKQQLIEELQTLGYYVGKWKVRSSKRRCCFNLLSAMCGDGANDCGALKAAHVGISLSEAESSVASPFTSKEANISCVPLIVREGRAALVTSFGVFKFMLCYSLTELASVMLLYGIDSNLTSIQFLFIDIFLILNFASVFGKTKAYTGPLFKKPPMTSLLGFVPLASIIWQMLIIIAFQIGVYYLIQTYSWFKPFEFNPQLTSKYESYENYAVYSLSMFQYIILAIVFSKGRPYRKPIYTNKLFTLSLILTTMVCVYLTIYPSGWALSLFELKLPPKFDGRTIILFLAVANLICSSLVEDFVVDILLGRYVQPKFVGWSKRMKYLKLRGNSGQEATWPIADCDMNSTVIVTEIDESGRRGKENVCFTTKL